MTSIWNNLTFSSITVIVFIRPPTLGFVSCLKVLITIFRVVFGFLYLLAQISLSVHFYRELTLLICSIKYFQPVLLLNLEMLSLFFLPVSGSFFLLWMDGQMKGWMDSRQEERKEGREGKDREKKKKQQLRMYLCNSVTHNTIQVMHKLQYQFSSPAVEDSHKGRGVTGLPEGVKKAHKRETEATKYKLHYHTAWPFLMIRERLCRAYKQV